MSKLDEILDYHLEHLDDLITPAHPDGNPFKPGGMSVKETREAIKRSVLFELEKEAGTIHKAMGLRVEGMPAYVEVSKIEKLLQ